MRYFIEVAIRIFYNAKINEIKSKNVQVQKKPLFM